MTPDPKSVREEIEALFRQSAMDSSAVEELYSIALRLTERVESLEANQHEPFVCVDAAAHKDLMDKCERLEAELSECKRRFKAVNEAYQDLRKS